MTVALRVLLATAINGVTIYGVFRLGWSVGTAVALYWCENVIGIVLISLLFVLHRAVTHKRGHERGVLKQFLAKAIPFTIVHGFFLFVLLASIFSNYSPSEKFDRATFKIGMMLIGGPMLLRFLFEIVRLKNVPFLQVRLAADSFLSRVVVVHLTIILGMFAMVTIGHPRALFVVFAALKFTADIIAASASEELPEKPPRFGLWVLQKLGGKQAEQGFINKWQRDQEASVRRMDDDELPVAPA